MRFRIEIVRGWLLDVDEEELIAKTEKLDTENFK